MLSVCTLINYPEDNTHVRTSRISFRVKKIDKKISHENKISVCYDFIVDCKTARYEHKVVITDRIINANVTSKFINRA